MSYRQIQGTDSVQRLSDGAVIPANEANRDWRAYQDWLAADHTPEPAVPDLNETDNTWS
jgi:hypothetical protein